MTVPPPAPDREPKFCPMCDVVLELHPDNPPDPDGTDCETAIRKADLLRDMDRAFGLTPRQGLLRGDPALPHQNRDSTPPDDGETRE